MHDKIVKIQEDGCYATMESGHVVGIGDFSNNDSITDSDDDDNDNYDIDDLMIAQFKAQIRSDYRRSLGKEFVRRLK
ncbi:MAG: hypothetical protein KAH86_09705 [Methanosarcinales archaeon]|nr:hypothetical protein [Methanosarcinales archaeon]